MTDLDRIAAWVAAEVADKGPLMNNPNHWGAGDWERMWAYVRKTAKPEINLYCDKPAGDCPSYESRAEYSPSRWQP